MSQIIERQSVSWVALKCDCMCILVLVWYEDLACYLTYLFIGTVKMLNEKIFIIVEMLVKRQ